MANIIRFGGGGGASKKKLAIEKLTEGTIVKIKEKGVEQDYYLAQHNYQPTLNGNGRTLFVRKNLHSSRVWDAGQVNAYAGSDIDIWLNGDFKGMFDADVREAMGETKFPYTAGNGTTTVSSLERSAFLLSGTELGKSATYLNAEGTALPIVSNLNPAYLDGTATTQWTRSPCTGNTYVAWVLLTDGTISSNSYTTVSFGARPCFTLHESCTVLEEVNSDGSYTLSLGDDNPEEQLFKLTVVDGTEQPTDVEDNTIWVNTDVDMGMCYLAPNAPDSPEVGDVWVNTTNKYNSNGTNASTNLIRVNDNPYLEINVLNISQWDGSAWVNREGSAIYANGAWTNMALWIWNYGTDGGYSFDYGTASNTGKAFAKNGSLTVDGDRYVLYRPQDQYPCGMQVNTAIDLSQYNKMKAIVSQDNGYSGGEVIPVVLGVGSAAMIGRAWNYVIDVANVTGNVNYRTETTIELDISNVTGDRYIGIFSNWSRNYVLYISVYQLVLTA